MFLLGKQVKNNEYVYNFLRKTYGLNNNNVLQILSRLGLSKHSRISVLQKSHIVFMDFLLKNFFITDIDLRKVLYNDIKNIKDVYSYKGHRHIQGLPVRGQRTHTNMRTIKRRKK